MQIIGQIRDTIPVTFHKSNPFLFFLADIISRPDFSDIAADKVLIFAKIAIREDKPPIVIDALKILNQLVNIDDGSFKNPDPTIFYGNGNFFWSELGHHHFATDVVSHILNKTLFRLSAGS